jgi:nucleotide-binding universal stress UspA family protein
MKISKLILASHGTPGARAAEDVAFELCVANNASLHHLLVVPDFWKWMMGDDWLNNAVTQARFGTYVEGELAREAAGLVARLAKRAERSGISYSDEVCIGKPAPQLVEACENGMFDIVVIGARRPKNVAGLRSRMNTNVLTRSLKTRLLIVPHPER